MTDWFFDPDGSLPKGVAEIRNSSGEPERVLRLGGRLDTDPADEQPETY